MTYLERFHLESISKKSTYRDSDPLVPLVLHDLATQPIVHSGNAASLRFFFFFFCWNLRIYNFYVFL